LRDILRCAQSQDYRKQVVSLKEILHHQNAKRGRFVCAHQHVKALADQLRSIEVKIEDEDLYMALLTSLPPSFNNLVTSLESMSTEDVDFQFIVVQLFHEISKRKESESTENATLFNKTHKAKFFFCFYCKKPRHFVRNCLKKKNDEKEKADQAYDDQEQMFVVALSANDHMVSSILVQHNT
jgi:hypothetical protein